MTAAASQETRQGTSFLDRIEILGNKVPHPVMMFLYLIIFIAVLSHILYLVGVSVTEEIAVPVPTESEVDEHGGLGGSEVPYPIEPDVPNDDPEYEIVEQTIEIESLLTVEGIRFVFSSFVSNFAGFGVVRAHVGGLDSAPLIWTWRPSGHPVQRLVAACTAPAADGEVAA